MVNVSFLPGLLMLVPHFLIYLAGLLLAVLNWNKNPRVSMLVTIAMLLFLVAGVGNAFTYMLPFWFQNLNIRPGQAGNVYGAVNLVRVFLSAVGWVLILIALFARQTGEVRTEPVYPE